MGVILMHPHSNTHTHLNGNRIEASRVERLHVVEQRIAKRIVRFRWQLQKIVLDLRRERFVRE
jgi:hypothetical protein